MKIISLELENELARQESHPYNVISARKYLEESLIFQFRKLANGLLAYLLLRGKSINNTTWWHYYLSQTNSSIQHLPNLQNEDFNLFRSKLMKDIAGLQVKPIKLSDLNKIEIRIYKGYVRLWDDLKINAQLEKLGSSFRLAFLGSHQLTVNYILNFLSQEIDESLVDGRFIFGRVGHMTTCPCGRIFDFVDEFAISPFLGCDEPGFSYDDNIVVRQTAIKTMSEARRLKNESFDEYQLDRARESIFTHESIHAFALAYHNNYAYIKFCWLETLTNDICRFTQSPRSFSEVENIFELNFKKSFIYFAKEIIGSSVIPDLPELKLKLKHIIRKMQEKKMIEINSDNYICSLIFKPGKRWTV